MDRTFALIASLLAMAAVIFGAFGAHALRGRLGPEDLLIFEDGACAIRCTTPSDSSW